MEDNLFAQITKRVEEKKRVVARLNRLAIKYFDEFRTEDHEVCNFKIQELPFGMIGVQEEFFIEDDIFGRKGKRFFWIDFTGKRSNYFNKMWDVYHDAQYNYPDYFNLLSNDELKILGFRKPGAE